ARRDDRTGETGQCPAAVEHHGNDRPGDARARLAVRDRLRPRGQERALSALRLGGVSWRIAGDYFESRNCDSICPCRMIDDPPSGRSTHGECIGVLSWLVREGDADSVPLGGLAAAMAIRYHDDEPGSPWTYVVHVDERASKAQREGLAAILTGR